MNSASVNDSVMASVILIIPILILIFLGLCVLEFFLARKVR